MNRVTLALCLALCAVATPADASFLRMIPNFTVEDAPDASGSLVLRGSVGNEGDESAQGVQLESATRGELLADLGTLGAGQSKPVEVVVEAERFGVREPGSYQIPFRLLYRDANGVPFSAVFLTAYQRTTPDERFAVSAPVAIAVEPERGPGAGLEVADSRPFEVEVRNLAAEPVSAEIRFLASKELRVQLPEGSRVELEPGASKLLRAELVNDRGLVNSSYATFALAEGVHQGRHFAEYTSFSAVITSPSATRARYTPLILLGVALAFLVGGLLFWLRTRAS